MHRKLFISLRCFLSLVLSPLSLDRGITSACRSITSACRSITSATKSITFSAKSIAFTFSSENCYFLLFNFYFHEKKLFFVRYLTHSPLSPVFMRYKKSDLSLR